MRRVEDALAAALLIALSGAADSFLLGAAWGTCLDIAGPHAGLVTGAMNTAGQIGAFLSPIILPLFLKEGAEDWATPALPRRRPLPRGRGLLAVHRSPPADPRRPRGEDEPNRTGCLTPRGPAATIRHARMRRPPRERSSRRPNHVSGGWVMPHDHFVTVPLTGQGAYTDASIAQSLGAAMASPFNFTDVFLYSHGWWTTAEGAMNDYSQFTIGLAAVMLASPAAADLSALGIGIHWPAMISEDQNSLNNIFQPLSYFNRAMMADDVGEEGGYATLRLIIEGRRRRACRPPTPPARA